MTTTILAAAVAFAALALLFFPMVRKKTFSVRQKILISAVFCLLCFSIGFAFYKTAGQVEEPEDMALQGGSHDVDAMLKALEGKLAKNPNDAEGWYVLGRSYMALSEGEKAEAALLKAVNLSPNEAKMLSQYAEAVAMNAGGDLQGDAKIWIEKALAQDAEEEKALELAGLAAFQREEFRDAIQFWKRLLKRLPPNSEFHDDIQAVIKQAEEKLNEAVYAKGGAETKRMQLKQK